MQNGVVGRSRHPQALVGSDWWTFMVNQEDWLGAGGVRLAFDRALKGPSSDSDAAGGRPVGWHFEAM